MTTRTTSTIVIFRLPFRLGGMESEQPAGRYVVETDEELLEDSSFPAYRRIATYLTLPRRAGGVISSEMIRVDPVELEAAVAGHEPAPAGPLAVVRQARPGVGPTLDGLRVQCRDLKDRWPSRRTADH